MDVTFVEGTVGQTPLKGGFSMSLPLTFILPQRIFSRRAERCKDSSTGFAAGVFKIPTFSIVVSAI